VIWGKTTRARDENLNLKVMELIFLAEGRFTVGKNMAAYNIVELWLSLWRCISSKHVVGWEL